MRYLLDTNTCIRYINGRVLAVRERMQRIPLQEISVSIITKAEMYYGAARSQTPERTLEKQTEFLQTVQTLLFDETAAQIYAQIRATTEKVGLPVGGNDLLIAASALAHNLILVTHNTREFERINGLILEDWEVPRG